jgi:uncharacterized protein YndB with AHSA1/START domain
MIRPRRPVVIELGALLPGPPEVVWDLITDWEHQDDWMLEARDFVVLSDQRAGVGVRARATVTILGITTTDEIEVTAWEPPRRLGIAHLGWVSGLGELFLTPLGDGTTHVHWRETLVPPLGLLGWLGLTAFKPLLVATFRRDLRVLAGLTRARGH